jgi:hypothetical protein
MITALLLSLCSVSSARGSVRDRYAVIVAKNSTLTAEQAQSILRSQAAPDPKQFIVLKYKLATFLVEPSLVGCADERRQLDSLNFLLKNATKEPVEFGRLPLEVQESLAIIGGSGLAKLDIKRTQVFLGSGVLLHLKPGKPGQTIIGLPASRSDSWPAWKEPKTTEGDELKFISLADRRSPDLWSTRASVKVLTLDGMTAENRDSLVQEAVEAVADSRKKVRLQIRSEMDRIGRKLAETLPDPTDWTRQKSMRVGDLPDNLRQSFYRNTTGLPGLGPSADVSSEWIEIQVNPVVMFNDGKSRLGASFTAYIN